MTITEDDINTEYRMESTATMALTINLTLDDMALISKALHHLRNCQHWSAGSLHATDQERATARADVSNIDRILGRSEVPDQ